MFCSQDKPFFLFQLTFLSPPQKHKTVHTCWLKSQICSFQVKVTRSSANDEEEKGIKKMTSCHQAPSVSDWGEGRGERKMKTAAYFLISHLCWKRKLACFCSGGAAATPCQCSEMVFISWIPTVEAYQQEATGIPPDKWFWYCVASASSLFPRLSSSHVIK